MEPVVARGALPESVSRDRRKIHLWATVELKFVDRLAGQAVADPKHSHCFNHDTERDRAGLRQACFMVAQKGNAPSSLCSRREPRFLVA
jgi:hypothetical protein